VRGLAGQAGWTAARVRASAWFLKSRPHSARGGRLGPAPDPLTRREREIADLVIGGLDNQAIAERLFISRRTVECHLSRVFTKLNVRSRTAMAYHLISRT
jgi:DNA-binding NarL/FixJ family response regulator